VTGIALPHSATSFLPTAAGSNATAIATTGIIGVNPMLYNAADGTVNYLRTIADSDTLIATLVGPGTPALMLNSALTGYSRMRADASNNLKVTLATALAGEDVTNDVMKVEQRFSNAYISTATTTTVKSGAGFLHTLTIGETAAGAITLYDNITNSGTIIQVFKASIAEQTFLFDVTFATGLTIVTAGASKISVAYR
jgi:hypothetical protein